MLAPVSFLFGIFVFLRRVLYRMRLLPVLRAGIPVVIVGNITAGGSGKTPLVLWIAQFLAAGGLYRQDLRTPAAEEFELSYRLRTAGIPIIFAPEIVGLHHQPVELSALCNQQYKYGVGLAEAAAKCGDLQGMPELQALLETNDGLRAFDPPLVAARKIVKALVGHKAARLWAARGVRLLEALSGETRLQSAYRTVLGASFYAGFKEGRRLYPPS